MNTQKQIFLIVVFMFMLVAGCGAYAIIDPIRADRQAGFFETESIERGALLFANNCRACHGNRGEGGIGLPLDREEFRNQDPTILAANQDLIRTTLYCGRAGTGMPPWLNENGGSLTRTQIEHLVRLITAPATEIDPETGALTSRGWIHAVEFAHNLNAETSVVVAGDTLSTIARQHRIGPGELAAHNGITVDTPVLRGDRFRTPDGRSLRIYATNETVTKLADRLHVGAILIAELNGFGWEITSEGTFQLIIDGQRVPGLLPGDTLRLPATAVYVVRSGDTLASIAEQHSITPAQIRDLNAGHPVIAEATADDEELRFEDQLLLPDGTLVLVQLGQSVGVIANQHGIEEDELLELNGLPEDAVVAEGDTLLLPDGAAYLIQPGDTLAEVAANHLMDEQTLAALNGLEPGAPIDPDVVLALPAIDAYVITGESLAEVATGFANVSASSLAETNDISADTVLRVGSELVLPDDAWGPAPPAPLPQTSPTVCVQHTVPQNIYEQIAGTAFEPERPDAVSSDVLVESHANDFTVVADGTAMTPNQGVVLVPAGTTILFQNVFGVHTVTVDGEKQGDDLVAVGDEQSVTFSQPASEYVITCDYHPDMKAWVYTE